MRMEDSTALMQVPLFASLRPGELTSLAGRIRRRHFPKGEVIFHRGDAGSVLYIIRSGQVKITLFSEQGQEAVLALLMPGDFFGELALFDGRPRSATAIAVEPTETIALHRDDFLEFIRRHPEVTINMFAVLSSRLRQTDELLEDTVFLDTPARLAKRLLELADTHGINTEKGTEINLRLTQQDLANLVGTTRETVNKELKAMRNRGLVAVERGRITILRPAALRRRIY